MKKRYKNLEKEYKVRFKEGLSIIASMIKEKSKNAKPKHKYQIPVNFLTKTDLENMEDYSVVRFGHSTLLYKIENEFILTDPVFSNRASPFSFMGPKRFHDNPIEIDELPFIKSVIISHDHYDHLDKKSIKKLKNKVETFYTTLEVGQHLMKFGVLRRNIVELDWWDSKKKDSIEFICTPAQHFSGRTLLDRDRTLWSSWVIKAPKGKFYFGADGGYFEGFKEIAFNHGPFDMSFLEVGAYNRKWRDIHMLPEDSIQAHKDLNAKVLFPIHNGTFDLSLHAWDEPFERISALAKKNNIDIRFPIMGEVISLLDYTPTKNWWR
ncbi:MBL fold metallo-hydrolase [Arcobacter sp. LA11]|uniref:MBL fold metallo-hydrolase n=1 Tax=Arcobacter sp. LA11 TaxID=1898176 RepID=UPI0009346778|nr:MBL fold metallo-hydrolase [Arcobacter sp. LA11]